jgi:hypothetical protein
MKCERSKQQLLDWINNEMTAIEKEEFETHLYQCAACLQELRAHQYIWDALGEMPVPEPSASMEPRFQSMLDAFKGSAREKKSIWSQLTEKIGEFWILQPKLRLSYSIIFILIGLAVGYLFNHPGTSNNYKEKIDSLSAQVHDMREMMMLSLLENPSASERIRAVSYTGEIKSANKQVIDALLSTLNNDPNVNVRLMTVDALMHFPNNPDVREGLVQSIVQQESPLMQVALADVMLKLQEKRSIQPFQKLLLQKDLNQMVRNKIEQIIHRLT